MRSDPKSFAASPNQRTSNTTKTMIRSSQDGHNPVPDRDTPIDLSVVVPLYNEEENVGRLYDALCESLTPESMTFELLFVDDGSHDGTRDVLRSIAARDARVRAICLRTNYGQTAAMRAGIEHARGKIIVTMDGDLQNNPLDIPTLVKKIDEGYDLVTGWRRNRKDPIISRKIPSKIANWIIRRVTKVPIHDTGCSLKAYRAELIRQVPLYSELHRFIPAMSTLATSRFAEVVVRHHPRQFGESKYGLSRVGKVVLDVLTVKMLISSARQPLHWFGLPAAGFFLLASTVGLGAAYLAIVSDSLSTFVLPVVALLLAYLAFHLLIAGLFGELVVRTEPTQRVEPLVNCYEITPQSSK